jgi:hypothetical protein
MREYRGIIFNFYGALESIPPAYVAWRYDNPVPARFLTPVDCSKIPAQSLPSFTGVGTRGGGRRNLIRGGR